MKLCDSITRLKERDKSDNHFFEGDIDNLIAFAEANYDLLIAAKLALPRLLSTGWTHWNDCITLLRDAIEKSEGK